MIQFFFENIKPVMAMVFLTTIIGFVFLNPKKTNHKLVLLIVTISSLNEITTLLLLFTNQQNYIGRLYSISFPLFCLGWLAILYKNQIKKKETILASLLFLCFVIINFIWLQGTKSFNYYTAVVGSFIYIGLVAYESFIQLKNENIPFVLSNTYLLLLSPLLLFFGYGQMFGFMSREITQTIILSNYNLFELVTNFVNVSYYAMILIYIFLEKKHIRNE
ncbi:MAG: hypothetical protein ACOVQR_07125 [Flavobacterium sp.]|uniref:hypothetical protein n=1 Tax=Flavobacterium sp. TaxID=239 RepID=UPI003BA4F77D